MKKIYLDTNIYIYLFQENKKYYSTIETLIEKIRLDGSIVCSTALLYELLSWKIPKSQVDILERELMSLDVLSLIDVNREISKIGARLTRTYNLSMGDAIQMATAIYTNCDTFITNDKNIRKIKEIKVLYLEDLI